MNMLPDFTDIDYLRHGNTRQQAAHRVLMQHGILARLLAFDPILVGTIPIGIDVEGSDLDIICCYHDLQLFGMVAQSYFGQFPDFALRIMEVRGLPSAVVSFRLEDFPVELFAQAVPTREQMGYRHMVIEAELLNARGEEFRQQIIALKRQGVKTEPAFAQVLGLEGDPYLALLGVTVGTDSVRINPNTNPTSFNEADILSQLDYAYNGMPDRYFPKREAKSIHYNFFLDLEHGYCQIAGSKIHLYADSNRWAVVFEASGYHNRRIAAMIDLFFVGNCILHVIERTEERMYVSNMKTIDTIPNAEFTRIQNDSGEGLECFELVKPDISSLSIREQIVEFANDSGQLSQMGIDIRNYENPNALIDFPSLVRYLHITHPSQMQACEEDIRELIPSDLPKLMTISEFHWHSLHGEEDVLPHDYETCQLIAKVLTTLSTDAWKPTLRPNNHWSNWNSGAL